MEPIVFLIAFPACIALLLLFVKAEAARKPIVYVSAALIAAASIYVAVSGFGKPWTPFAYENALVDGATMVVSIAIAATIIAYAVKYKNVLAGALAVIQVVGSMVFEIGYAHGCTVENALYFDSLTLIMTLIIGVVGSGICVYALGYMEDFQAHEPEESKDRRPVFFALMFLFLSAMNVIVFSNNMTWLFCGWEVTTLCSFLLIGYTKTEEAIRNAFRQINMNLLGGLGFLLGLYVSVISFGTLDLDKFIELGALQPTLAALPVCALAFAGLTKAAQMPFHTWLLGAMVAPTPTSALLHSSTMVKAGVFLLVKLSPVLAVCAIPRTMVVLIGLVTFLLCSFMAISQSNAKRVLAYSTIANLGLICACAGIGTAEAVWAAAFLIVFHAVAKSLLFLCVGTAEHHIGSRDIEDMDLLFERMPRLARYMMVGIMGMFVAPFGMLLSKWAALVAFVDTGNMLLVILLAFGSAATFMFWAKWLGKLAGIAGTPDNVERGVHPSEWVATTVMVCLVVAVCALLPLVSEYAVEPYVAGVFGTGLQTLSDDNLWISSLCCIVLAVVLVAGIGGSGKARKVDVYMSGVSVNDANREYRDSLSGVTKATARNLYLESMFGEKIWSSTGSAVAVVLILVAFIAASAPVFGLM